ncbi:hypothetical protein [Allisonella histaminiformans]|uniref:hypothetical protein n=1 Tax=Allisonella histaminiformans TaxID=209880 RepID=UPI002E791D39|nr:hypothetical protein [Allisonella histaminiformans]
MVHEAAHFYLTTLLNLEQAGVKNKQLMSDLKTIRDWAGYSYKKMAEYKGTTLEKEFQQKEAEPLIQKYLDEGMLPAHAVDKVLKETDFKAYMTKAVKDAMLSSAVIGASSYTAGKSTPLDEAWDPSGMTLSEKLHGTSKAIMSLNQWTELKQELTEQENDLSLLKLKLKRLKSTSSEQMKLLEILQNELDETQKNLTTASISLTECQNALKESRESLQTLKAQINK